MSQDAGRKKERQGKLSKYKGYGAACFLLVALDLSWRGRGTFGGRLQKPTESWLRKSLQQDHKRTHAEIARKGKQSSHDTGTLSWHSMKYSAACLCKAEGRFSKHRSGWSKPPTPTTTSGEIKNINTQKNLENPTTKQALNFFKCKGAHEDRRGRKNYFSPLSAQLSHSHKPAHFSRQACSN